MSSNIYCSMIHGGLILNLKSPSEGAKIGHCCLMPATFNVNDVDKNFWHDTRLNDLRELNQKNIWDPRCLQCKRVEDSGHTSMRVGMNEGLKIYNQTNLSGPARIDLMFDISCNLACRTCTPFVSTFWQKHLKEHNLRKEPISVSRSKDDVIAMLENLDLSNLKQIVFSGGETLLGQEYWSVAEWLVNNVPNAKEQLTIAFQTNGTQPISLKNFKTIEKAHLVKLHISIDGINDRFEYLRWPAKWDQVTDNILTIRDACPSNVMFLVEETISIFNLPYIGEVKSWLDTNFLTNREGDPINHGMHLANGIFSVSNCSQEYVDAIKQTNKANFIAPNFQENSTAITTMIAEIKKFDHLRNQKFEKIFPEVAEYYKKYL